MGKPADNDHLDALDGLRGAAVLIVMASHWSNFGFGLLPLSMGGTGKSGVYLFYVLSAYLLTRLMLLRGARTGFGNARLWGDYALRRVLRIWPLYLVVLLLSWFLTVRGVAGWHYQIGTESLLRHLTLREGQSVLWSIPVEFTFYFLLPPLTLAAAWLRRHAPAWAEVVVAVGLVVAVLWVWPSAQAPVNDFHVWHYLPVFLCGVFAARIDVALAAGQYPRSWPWAMAGVGALLAFAVTVPQAWSWLSGTPLRPDLGHRWFLFFGVLWSVLLLAVLHGPAWLRWPFANRGLRWVGLVSFSAYLWHMPVLDFVRAHWTSRGAAPGWIALLLALGLAGLSWWCLERPWRGVRLRQA